MNNTSVKEDLELESLIARVADEFRECQERGDRPQIEDYAARYPQAAPLLRKVLSALELIDLSLPGRAGRPAGEAVAGTLGDFRILREIGRGGMGIVYEAEQISLGRRVALKVLPFAAALDSKQLQRFKNEAHAAAHLQHQNIVPVYAVGCERGVHFYAMQFVEGQTMAALIQELRQMEGRQERGSRMEDRTSKIENGELQKRVSLSDPMLTGPCVPRDRVARPESSKGVTSNMSHPLPSLPPLVEEGMGGGDSGRASQESATINDQGAGNETAPVTPRSSILHPRSSFFRTLASLGIQAAEALEHAHQLGVIHRDIKPANLMVDARGNLWITDFGLAHCQGGCELTMSGDLLGTLRYMSPEQALAKRVIVDERTDIYSLGATLYELLTLEPAFPGTDRQEILRQIAFEEPKPPPRVSKAIPQELETIVLKAMEKSPADRYATAQELADELERFLKDEPIRAKRPTLVRRALKWMRRHKAAVWAGVVCLSVTLIALGSAIGWAVRDRADRLQLVKDKATEFLNDADEFRKKGQWPEALAAVERAQAALAGGQDTDMQARVADLLTELRLIRDLEDIRNRQSNFPDGPGIDRSFARLFADFDIDMDRLSPAEVAARIRRRPTMVVRLAAALDDWAIVRRDNGLYDKQDAATWQRLLEAARLADPVPWRSQLRQLMGREDLNALRQLADSSDIKALPVQSLRLMGNALLFGGDDAASIAWLRKAHRQHPGDVLISFDLACRLRSLPSPPWPEVVQVAEAAVAAKPDSPAMHILAGDSLSRLGRYEEAIAACSVAIDLKPDYWEPWSRRSQAYLMVGQNDKALADHVHAVKLNARKAWANRGAFYAGLGQWAKAFADYKEAIELDPTDHFLWFQSAALALQLGDGEGYRRICRELLRRFSNTDKPDVAEGIARTCSLGPDAVGDFESVSKVADWAVARDPSNRWVLLAKGMTDYRAGRYADAVTWLEHLVHRATGAHCRAAAFAVLALAQHRLGRPKEARAALDSAHGILAEEIPDPADGRSFDRCWHCSLHARILCREAEARLGMKEEKTRHQDTKDTKKSEDRRLRIENREQ
jgi:serine/threonine protein kinase/tetratricopeptide (TPR) repeat protein